MNLATNVAVGIKVAEMGENGCTVKEASEIYQTHYFKKIIEFPLLVENNASRHCSKKVSNWFPGWFLSFVPPKVV